MAENILESLTASNIFDLQGVVAVVTGGGTGIGLMISSTLVANGATVYIIGPKQDDLDRIAEVYNKAAATQDGRGRMHGIQGDVREKSEAVRLASEVAKREPHVTILFNNAGIHQGLAQRPAEATAAAFIDAYFDPVTQEHFTNSINTNSVGPYWLTFAFLPLLEKWKADSNPLSKKFVPQIVMTSSMNGWTKDSATGGNSFPYLFSKSAIGHATSSLAHELLPLGIRVNGIAPGWFVTEMSMPGTIDSLGISHAPPDHKLNFSVPTVPTGGTPRDMGTLALFLVANWFVNGETVLIDGGTLLKHPSSY
ncbi:NAD(P)-binding protein [Punctularia strigosozonata HHB-11173 SS5]|uniref:NAD(P)-binding protein n=1 Tax=Punctularia strigosozonata (strain HHB-11173) TaxID=741275 RepID=R7S1S2_PUNST|nr:NAD(P)-binding protein [Punctularia strigosozonata HHB-11173 SS5]EIN04340.1 NAD(P)-binding protein [Punctularia strigosozonata HHB-11173 SS5]